MLAARNADKLASLAESISALALRCDASRHEDVTRMFTEVSDALGPPGIVVYNASGRTRGPVADLDPAEVERTLAATAFGGFLVGQQAARVMLARGSGVIVFTGASASVKGFAQSAPFAMGKFALRGLAQSMARELGPRGIHVAHVIVDGAIRSARNHEPADAPDSRLDRTRSPTHICSSWISPGAHGRTSSRSGPGSRGSDRRGQLARAVSPAEIVE